MRSVFVAVLVAAVALLLAGCSRPGVKKVSGAVTLDGKPLEGADVRFVPKEDLTLGEFGGRTGADGTFSIAVGGPGMVAKPGQYVALVTKGQGIGRPAAPAKTEAELKEAMKATAPGMSAGILPPKYAEARTSPFTVDIKEGTTELPPFALSSKP
jgi:hypothetical protein